MGYRIALIFCCLTFSLHANAATNSAVIAQPRVQEARWHQVYEQTTAELKAMPDADTVFLGDSITQRWRLYPRLWDKLFAGHRALNAGIFSDGTQHLLWRLQHGQLDGLNPRLVVMMIGTNNGLNTAEEIADGVQANINEAHRRFPQAKILVLGILPSGDDPKGKRRLRNKLVNRLIQAHTDQITTFYAEFDRVFEDHDGHIPRDLMPDQLHPSARGYELWAEAMAPLIRKFYDSKDAH